MMRWLGAICLLFLGGCGTPVSIEMLYEQGRTALEAGSLEEALALCREGLGSPRLTDGEGWLPRFQLLKVEILLNRRELDQAEERLAGMAAEASPQPWTARRIMLRGDLAAYRKDLQKSTVLWKEAYEIAKKNGWPGVCAELEIRLSKRLNPSGGDLKRAAKMALEAAIHAKEAGRAYLESICLNQLGFIRLRQLRYDEAIAALEPALEKARKNNRQKGHILTNLGLCYGRLGFFEKALIYLREAVEAHREQGSAMGVQATLGETGNVFFYQKSYDRAIEYYQQALILARANGYIQFASRWAGNLSSAFTFQGEWDQAEAKNALAMKLKKECGDESSIPHLTLSRANIALGRSHYGPATDLCAQVLASAGETPALLWGAHSALGTAYARQFQWEKANAHFETALSFIEESVRLKQPEHGIGYFSRLIGFYQDYVETLLNQNNPLKALEIAERSRARILAERQGMVSTRPGTPTHAAFKAEIKDPKTVALFYWLAPKRSFLWVVTQGNLGFYVLPPEAEINRQAKIYWEFIQELGDPLAEPHPAGAYLYKTLIEPASGHLFPGAQVVVIPDGSLHGLNFETLPVYNEAPHYWIQDISLGVAPYLSFLLEKPKKRLRKLDSLLLIGDSEDRGPDFPKLDYAADEVREIQAHFPRMDPAQKIILTEAAATPVAYGQADPGRFSMLHFTAHGKASLESPLDSAIILSALNPNTSFKLYARDIIGIPLSAEVVTISSCSGAGIKAFSGEGLVGFAWAFLQAGANHVIAGLWDVADDSTYELMNGLYGGLSRGLSPPSALRQAKLKLVNSAGNYNKPYYWGPFQIFLHRGNSWESSAL